MQRLKPGMTEKRVWRELGLDGYRKERGMGGGGGDSCWSGYHLGVCPSIAFGR
jgi:hypothetical protein